MPKRTHSPQNWTKVWREARRDLRRASTQEQKDWAQIKMAEAEKHLKPHQLAELKGE
jgi:hypothetical protein